MDKNDKSWLKLLPAAAVFAAVCITCYQAEKSPVETAAVSDNSVMSVKEIKELIQTGTTEKANTDASSQKEKASAEKNQKRQRKQVKSKPAPKRMPLPELPQRAVHRQGEQEQPPHPPPQFRQMDMWTALIQALAQALGAPLPYRSQFPGTRSQQLISWMLLLRLPHILLMPRV